MIERGTLVLLTTLLLAMVLAVITLPASLPMELGYLRPDWVLLVLIYWVIALPHRIGIGTAWCLGLLMDVLLGSLFGQHALSFVLVAYVSVSLYQRLRMFAVWQQSLVVFAMIGVHEVLGFWVESIAGLAQWSIWLLLPAVISALMWPWVFLALRFLRRSFRIA